MFIRLFVCVFVCGGKWQREKESAPSPSLLLPLLLEKPVGRPRRGLNPLKKIRRRGSSGSVGGGGGVRVTAHSSCLSSSSALESG